MSDFIGFMVSRVVDDNMNLLGLGITEAGYRSFGLYTLEQVKNIIDNGGKIINIKITSGLFQGTEGGLDRYPAVTVQGELLNKPAVYVRKALGTDWGGVELYKVLDYKGTETSMSYKQLLSYGINYGIANANIGIKNDEQCIEPIGKKFRREIIGRMER